MARAPRAVDPAQVFSRLQQDIERGLPPGLFVLTGDDLFHLDRAQHALLEHLVPPGTSEFALTVYGDEKVQVGAVVAAARSVGMFASRRVVLVRDHGALEGEPDALVAFAKAPPPASYLVVRALGLDQRFKLHKALATAGRLLRFERPGFADPRRGLADVKRMAASRKLRLDPRAAAFLAEVTAGDLYRLTAEMDKLRDWAASEPTNEIGFDVAREVAAGGDVLSGWEVADAITVRDRGAALEAVARLVESGVEPVMMIGGLAWRARMLLQAKALKEAGMPADQVVKATRAWSYRDALLRGLGRYSLPELLAFPAILLDADRSLKSRSLSARGVLEHLVHRLTSPSASAPEPR